MAHTPMNRAHVFVIRFRDRMDDPSLRVVVAQDEATASKLLEDAEGRNPYSSEYCGDVDPTSAALIMGSLKLDGINTAAALRFAAAEYEDLTSSDKSHLRRISSLIEDRSYDRIMDAAVAHSSGRLRKRSWPSQPSSR